jgi:hypothetical protein
MVPAIDPDRGDVLQREGRSRSNGPLAPRRLRSRRVRRTSEGRNTARAFTTENPLFNPIPIDSDINKFDLQLTDRSIGAGISSPRYGATLDTRALPPQRTIDPVTGDFIIDLASDPSFIGDSGFPSVAGHYSQHSAPGTTQMVHVSYRAAR